MRIEIPLYQQEKDNTCALACLRMVLAAFGTHIEERALEAEATMEEGGTLIAELERLARQHRLIAEIQEVTVEECSRLLAEGKLPIAYIDRAVFDLTSRQRAKHSLRNCKIHCVVPTRVTEAYVTFNDPLKPQAARRSIELFRQAYASLGNHSLVCTIPDET